MPLPLLPICTMLRACHLVAPLAANDARTNAVAGASGNTTVCYTVNGQKCDVLRLGENVSLLAVQGIKQALGGRISVLLGFDGAFVKMENLPLGAYPSGVQLENTDLWC
jgi:hypothetical protein